MSLPTGDLTVETARARMLASFAGVAPKLESLSLNGAAGRTLAEPVNAQRDQPPFNASAMDGWAVSGPGDRYWIVGESAAGRGYPHPLQLGEAVRIFTGAPVPQGADRVVIQEDATREDRRLATRAPPGSPTYIRPRGGDFRGGDTLLRAGQRLDPWRLSLAAAAGLAELTVARRPKVAILSTGEEIVQPGRHPGFDQIYDSATPALAALISRWGGEAARLATVGDSEDEIADTLTGPDAQADLIVTVGGASVGDHDLVKPALRRLGLELQVESVRLRPGKPTWFGVLEDGRRVLGLPGNPASALVCAELFLKPLLMAMQGADPSLTLVSARLAAPLPANGPREHWARASLSSRDGGLWVQPMTDQESSLVSVFARADALVRCPAGMAAAEAGAAADILLLDRL